MSYVPGRAPWYTHMQIHTHACNSHTNTHSHSPTYNYTCLLHIFFSYFSFECCKSALQLDIFLKPSGALQYLSFQCVCLCVCVHERVHVCVCGKVVTLPKFWQSCEMNFEWRRIISKWNLKRLPAATELLPSFSLCLYFTSPFPPYCPHLLCFRSKFNTFTSCSANKQVAKYMFPSKLIANWICNLFGFLPKSPSSLLFFFSVCGFLLSLLFLYFFRYLSQIWNFNFHNRMNPSSLFVH